jgi:endonuclease/exonuclease/phosphatase family metal-dependent hydrolase
MTWGVIGASAGDVSAQVLRVISWNIRYDNPGDGPNRWTHRKDWFAEIVVAQRVDVAGFQEVLAGQLRDLRQRLPDFVAYGVSRDDGAERGEFSPIFYRRERFELLDRGTFWLSPTPDEIGSKGWDAALPRIASWVKLKDRPSGKTLTVLNTHFDHRGETARQESAALLVRQLEQMFAAGPVILTGDFNSTPDSAPYRTLTTRATDGRGYQDTYVTTVTKPEGPASTWNGFESIVPDRRIDFIFTTPDIRVDRLRILTDQKNSRFPSDHLPVVADLELSTPP